ncbi:restriction endonuclease subunit S [Streptomyces sp. CB01881]|uniref:restriction endonuclease subunit S n=1 Tax=Streptomyces sp. CB01881 TaxID=2078691 RepID=UPI000CDBF7DC|nr:restriction endonuclease subunit S [Streptomyces sp. CB01881]AUY49231.1 restriction endonuclease subunit S [Streptomyces sp. CB01881]TYC72623.1 restriction endonuclease subunit S [Streptomyces sp. CB01881]
MSTTELPPGWEKVCLGDVLLRVEAGKSFTCEPRQARPDEWGIIKVSAMTWGTFNEGENKAVPEGREINPAYEIQAGDILVSRANTRAYVGAPVLVGNTRRRLLLSDKSLRLVPSESIDKRWLVHFLSSPVARDFISKAATGTKDSMRNISQQALLEMPIAVPPLAEQQRIVDTLEDHLSRLDAAVRDLGAAHRKVFAFRKAVLMSLVPEDSPESWEITTVGEAGSIDLGRQRHPDWHHGPEMRPYLRVANVFEDRIDTADVMEMDFSGVFERYKLEPGDVLLNEGQSPHLVGRPALYRGQPADVAFTNSLLRFRARPDVLPEWALMVFRRHLHARRFMREVRITTNIAHLSSKRLKNVEFPIPPLEEQKRLVQRCEELLTDSDALERALKHGLARAQSLRKAILGRAFTGTLVPQDPKDEPASALFDRIRAEQAASGKGAARRARSPRKTERATKSGLPPAPFTAATSAPVTTIQQEFEL